MEWLSSQWILAIAVILLFAAGAVIAFFINRQLKPKPEVFTEGTPLKLPRREGPHIRVPYNTEVNVIIELEGEKFYVTHVSHDFGPGFAHTYATLKPVTVPPSRYEILMEDE